MMNTIPEYSINDFAKVTNGPYKGKIGKVINIPMREDGDIRYRVIFPDNLTGSYLPEKWLEPAFSDEDEAIIESMIIEDTNFKEMSTIRGGFDSIKLTVFESEGQIPHFHFYKGIGPEKGINYTEVDKGGCICILEPKYFIHGNHTEKLSRKETKDLITFLNSRHKSLKSLTNWEYIITLWNDNNSERIQVDIKTPIPEYTHDMGSIHDKKK